MNEPEPGAPKDAWRAWARGLGPVGHDHGICRAIIDWLPGGALVGAYVALPDEPDLTHVLEHLGTVALARVTSRHDLEWHRVHWGETELVVSPHRTREPAPDTAPVDPALLDVVLVPGQAFDRRGVRLGRGGGHYDRALACLPRAAVVGVAAEPRIVDALPRGEHDVAMTHLATAGGVNPVRG